MEDNIVYDNFPTSRMEKIVMFIAVLCMIVICIFIGMDIGLHLLTLFMSEVCEFQPPDPPIGIRDWNGSYAFGSIAFYYCSKHQGAIIYWIRECNPAANSWTIVLEDSCSCLDELPPVTRGTARIPDEYSNKIGAIVTYKCYDDDDAPEIAMYVCNEQSVWDYTNLGSCECTEEPPEPESTGTRMWPNEYSGYGSIIRYFCTKDTISAVSKLVRCSNEGKWETFFERDCKCRNAPDFVMTQEHKEELAKTESEIGVYHELHCILDNPNTITKYAVRCGISVLWELVEYHDCNLTYRVITEADTYIDAKTICYDDGGEIAQIKNAEENDAVINVTKLYSDVCKTFYIGVEEDMHETWLSTNAENVVLTSDVTQGLGSSSLKCLILKLPPTTSKTVRRDIENVDCKAKYCYFCSFIGLIQKFYIGHVPLNYNDATFDCVSRGGFLAPVSDMKVIMHAPVPESIQFICGLNYYIGGHSYGRKWMFPNSMPITFSYWDINEPNNFKEQCVVISVFRNYYWLDVLCNIPSCFVCQIPGGKVDKSVKEQPQQNCTSGWLEHEDSCYLFTEIENTFESAKNYCQNFGSAYVVGVYSSDGWDFVVQNVRMLYGAAVSKPFHLGLERTIYTNHTFIDAWNSGHDLFFTLLPAEIDYSEIPEDYLELKYCSAFMLTPDRWEWNDCTMSALLICRDDLRCNIPREKEGTRLHWNGKRGSGAQVTYYCAGTTIEAQHIKFQYECSKSKTWLLTYSGKCDYVYEAIPMQVSFHRSKQECERVHGYLAMPIDWNVKLLTDAMEANKLHKEFCYSGYYLGIRENTDVQWQVPPRCESNDSIDMGHNVSFFWKNLSKYWGYHQPQQNIYRCVVLSYDEDYRMKNEDCNKRSCFICETSDFQFFPQLKLMNYQEAVFECEKKNMTLASVRNDALFERLQNSARKVDSQHCVNYFLILKHIHREYQFTDGTLIDNKVMKNIDKKFRNFSGQCMALMWYPKFHLVDAYCNAPRCFMCQVVPDYAFENLNLATGPDRKCPPDFLQYQQMCFYPGYSEVTHMEAHRRCLNNGSFLISFHTESEFNNVSKMLESLNQTMWHTGLTFGKMGTTWRGGQFYRKYPRVFLDAQDDTKCSILKRSLSNTFHWSFMTQCDIYASYLCELNTGFLGFFDMPMGFFIRPKLFTNKVGIRQCISQCSDIRYNYTVVATIASTYPQKCLCADGVNNMDIVTTPFTSRSSHYKCQEMQTCQDSHEICACDYKDALFILGAYYYVGCYQFSDLNWQNVMSFKSAVDDMGTFETPEARLSNRTAKVDADTQIHFQQRCRLACIAQHFDFATVEGSSETSEQVCSCFHDLPDGTIVQESMCSISVSRKTQEQKSANTFVLLFRLPNQKLVG